ncbi:probable C-mannosyltransferase DPY19L1 [Aricia agestis]|uniref:probable C-mannosyltransferase DPY19L1 n=1 Tax=Aricia agestis TaxID=91739 RepID=UPI001C20BD3C|nr:probable C-mannosyltransferase DPY19L1 [Aricia agestis]
MNDNAERVQRETVPPKNSCWTISLTIFTICLAISLAFIHYKYVSMLFENDRNFSHLSELEREMSLRTEMGFYYSYYKTVVESNPFSNTLAQLMYDRLVEYPKEVNAFNRFNIYPEVMLGCLYRYLEPMINTSCYKECHLIERGGGYSPVESCVGIGQPIYFYLEAVWWLAGLTVAALFLHAVALSQSIVGGLFAVVQYFANHAECTRVQWAPNERENFAMPFLLLQMWLLTLQLREKGKMTKLQLQVSIFIVNIICLLFWQFSQFIFLTQTAIFFLMEQLRIIDIKTLSLYLHSQFCSIQTAVLMLQGNDMLKSSLFVSFFLAVSAYCLFFSSLRVKIRSRWDVALEAGLVTARVMAVAACSLYIKRAIGALLEVEEDTHVWDILRAKLTGHRSFHTMIYTCSEVFDYLPLSSLAGMTRSLLLPLAALNVVSFAVRCAAAAVSECARDLAALDLRRDDDDDSGIEGAPDLNDLDKRIETSLGGTVDSVVLVLRRVDCDAAVVYNAAQAAAFGVMAALVMRLKLLFAAQCCVLFSLTFNKSYYALPKSVTRYMPLVWALYVLTLGRALVANVSHEMSHIGEFSDYPQEQLLKFISTQTGPGAFAGSMPVSATVMLATRRPVIAHPHYEHLDARKRAYDVYKVYGRFSAEEYYADLSRLRATYLIIETKYCYGRSNKGCSFADIWDVEEPELRARPPLCHTLLTQTVDHFYPLFRNEHYALLRVHDFSVRYMPRSFDT